MIILSTWTHSLTHTKSIQFSTVHVLTKLTSMDILDITVPSVLLYFPVNLIVQSFAFNSINPFSPNKTKSEQPVRSRRVNTGWFYRCGTALEQDRRTCRRWVGKRRAQAGVAAPRKRGSQVLLWRWVKDGETGLGVTWGTGRGQARTASWRDDDCRDFPVPL